MLAACVVSRVSCFLFLLHCSSLRVSGLCVVRWLAGVGCPLVFVDCCLLVGVWRLAFRAWCLLVV